MSELANSLLHFPKRRGNHTLNRLITHFMESQNAPPKIRDSSRFNSGILVEFEDGKCVLFSAEVLYAHIAQGQDLTELATSEQALARVDSVQ